MPHSLHDILLNNIADALSAPNLKTATIISSTTTGTITASVNNITFQNVGAAAVTVTASNGVATSVPAAGKVEFDAGGNGNRFAPSTFSFVATGSTLLVTYVS